MEFRDRKKIAYDWDNEEIEKAEDIVQPAPSIIAHPGIPAEIPGVELETDREMIVDAIEKAPKSDLATRAAAARENANFLRDPGVAASKITGVIKQKKKEVIVIDDDSSDEDDGYDTGDSYAGIPYMVKREYDTSDDEDEDEDIDISTHEVEEDEDIDIEVERLLPPHLRPVPALGRGQ